MNTALTLSIAQINPTIGDFVGNLQLAEQAFKQAAQQRAQLLVFPELSVTGYYPGDLLCEAGFLRRTQQALQSLLALSARTPEITALIGLPTANSGPGKSLFNSLLAVRNGQVIAEYHKQLLPTYNIFDERRHFEPGPSQAVCIDVAGYRIGLLICEDGWNDNADDYPVNPYQALAAAEPDLIVSINASPSNLGKRQQRQAVISSAAQRYQLPMLYVNQVGGQDSIVFDGGSFAVNADGSVAREWPMFASVIESIGFTGGQFISDQAPRAPISDEEFMLQQCVLGLKDYSRRCGFQQVLVGSSGGIDSALTLAIAVEALGADNVKAITMPSQFSSSGSVSDSERLCQNLGIELFHYSIKNLVDEFGVGFDAAFNRPLQGLSLENLQARVRGTVLMAYSNDTGALLLTTGNKSEISVGYCTLYGDTNGGLGLLGDLYKTEVYRLSAYINQRAGRDIIPHDIISKPPSAELAPGQKDTDSLPPYEVLDELLKWLIEGPLLPLLEYQAVRQFVDEFRKTQVGEETYQRIARMITRNEYKRRQAPPIIRIRPRAFGAGRQMPIAAIFY